MAFKLWKPLKAPTLALIRPIGELVGFLRAVATDSRIPPADKAVVVGLLALLVSPIDLIPVIGQIDEVLVISLLLDYLFRVLDRQILLDHWPWSQKAFKKIEKSSRWIGRLAPDALRKWIWSYARKKSS